MTVTEQMKAVAREWHPTLMARAWPALTELVREVESVLDRLGDLALTNDLRDVLAALAAALPPVPSEENPDAR